VRSVPLSTSVKAIERRRARDLCTGHEEFTPKTGQDHCSTEDVLQVASADRASLDKEDHVAIPK
jgi:hypothetical protein